VAGSCAARLLALLAASLSLVVLVDAVLLPAAPSLVLVHALCALLPYLLAMTLARARDKPQCGALGAAAFAASLCIVTSLRDLAPPSILGLALSLLAALAPPALPRREGQPHAADSERASRRHPARACAPGAPFLCLLGVVWPAAPSAATS
jgi:hypothetical protein